jgi:hypothetical protein
MGSTSYDDARDPLDATWSGASWYGPTTGEYWIVNPREYADPRKHGPDYQSRARRTQVAADDVPEPGGSSEPDGAFGTETTAPGRPRAEAGSRLGTAEARGWAAPIGDTFGPAREPRVARPDLASRQDAGERGGPRRQPIGATTRELLGGPTDDPIRRLGLALLAWPPIGLAAAAAIGEVTGCTTFAAECGGSDTLLPWLAQAGILGLLLLLPPVARLFAGGSIAVVLALLPMTAFLVVVGGSGEPEAGPALAVLLAVTWLLGVGWSIVSGWRGRPGRGADRGAEAPT